jgi:dual specificity protein kinase YAK1
MDQQWQPYSDIAGSRQARYAHSTPQQQTRDTSNGLAQHQPPPSGFSYEAYQIPSLPSHPQSMATSPIGTPHSRAYSGDGDVAMEDADPYNRMKYPSRPSHQHRSSGQYVKQEDSSAARRYSPMKALSPSSQYATSPQQPSQGSYGPYPSQNISARQSPTRPNLYSTPSQSYYTTPSESSKQ